MEIFADADFFIGLYLINDAHHKDCLQIAKKITEEVITSYDVIDEVATKLNYFGRKDKVALFISDIKKTRIKIIFADILLFESAIKIFLSQTTKHISLTDCMNMAIMRKTGIKKVLSFDKIYEKNGFKLIK